MGIVIPFDPKIKAEVTEHGVEDNASLVIMRV